MVRCLELVGGSRVFELPTPAGIRWRDIEAMLRAYGVNVVERSGSRVARLRAARGSSSTGRTLGPETGRATVRDIAAFLKAAGVQVEGEQRKGR